MSAADHDSGDVHGLRERLARFALAMAALLTGLTALGVVVSAREGEPLHLLTTLDGGAQLSLILVALFTWARARCASAATVRTLDALLPLWVGGTIAFVLWGTLSLDAPDLVALLLVTLVLLARAALVPSSTSVTVGIGLLAFAPTVFAAARGFGHPALALEPSRVVFATLWSIGAVSVAGLCSHVVYDLRDRVQTALHLGPYELVRPIGEGGMGQVFEARHARLQRPAAIKLLHGDLISEAALTRFEQEVQITATLRHPNTVSIYDYGRTATGTFFYVMELLEGMSLSELVKAHGPLPSARVAFILEQVVGALAEAHRQGLVHRDVKPANVMVGERAGLGDYVTVVDFGLAHRTLGQPSQSVAGTPSVLAPEVIHGRAPVSAAVDLYAVGATAYFALTGTFPFIGERLAAVCAGHLRGQVTPPSERLGRAVDSELEAIVMRCLEKAPEDRFRDAPALLEALHRVPGRAGWNHDSAAAWWRTHAASSRPLPRLPAPARQCARPQLATV